MSVKTERAEQKAHITARIHALRAKGLSHKAIATRLSVAQSMYSNDSPAPHHQTPPYPATTR